MNYNFELRVKIFALLILTAFGIAACGMIDGKTNTSMRVITTTTTSTLLPPADITCLLISATYEGGNDADQLRSIWGEIDYNGETGQWTSVNSHAIIGYSSQEDSVIWNLAQCADAELPRIPD